MSSTEHLLIQMEKYLRNKFIKGNFVYNQRLLVLNLFHLENVKKTVKSLTRGFIEFLSQNK